MYKNYLKRLIDIGLSVLVLILFSWLFILVGIFIKLTSKGPIIFKQKRIGQNKKEFYIYKLRTMYVTTPSDVPTHAFENSIYYITPIGRWLRRSSLDELPQIINILHGDMSFVGPRPALWNQYDLISEREKYGANDVRPGLTGLAQVNGRDELPITVKAKLDGEYVTKLCFLLDIHCVLKTFGCVFKQEGIREGM